MASLAIVLSLVSRWSLNSAPTRTATRTRMPAYSTAVWPVSPASRRPCARIPRAAVASSARPPFWTRTATATDLSWIYAPMLCMSLNPPEERLTDRLRPRLRSTRSAHQRLKAQLQGGQRAQSGVGPGALRSAAAHPEPQRDRLRTRVHADLLVDATQVVLHRLVGDEQLLGDVAVRAPTGEQVEDLALAPRERAEPLLARVVVGARRTAQHVEHGRRDRGREHHLAARDGDDALLELLGLEAAVHQVAGRAVADRAGDEVLLVAVGEHQHLGLLAQRAGRGDAVHDRHPHVQADHVGPQLGRARDRLPAVRRLADDLDLRALGQQARDAAAHDRVVVDEKDLDHCHVNPGTGRGRLASGAAGGASSGGGAGGATSSTAGASSGTHTDTTQPSPGADSTSRPPPAIRARSCMPRRPKLWPLPGSRSSGTSKPRPSSATVRTAREPNARRRTPTRLALACWWTFPSASRRIHSSSRAATGCNSPTSSTAMSTGMPCERDQRMATSWRTPGSGRVPDSSVSPRRATMSSRASRVACRASSASRRASAAAPSGSRSIRRSRASAPKPIPATVLASESCRSRARLARSVSAALRRSCSAICCSKEATRSSRLRAPTPAAATSRYSAGWPTQVWNVSGTASMPARTWSTHRYTPTRIGANTAAPATP